MTERNAIIAIKEANGRLEILDALCQVHKCAATPEALWAVVQRVLADESLPSVRSQPRARTNGNGREPQQDAFTPKKEEEHIRNIANAALGQMGPVAQAAAPLLVARLGKFLRKVSR